MEKVLGLENHHFMTNIVKTGWRRDHWWMLNSGWRGFDEEQGICMSECLLTDHLLVTREKSNYSWPLSNTSLNCTGAFTRRFFLIVNTTVLHDPWCVEFKDGKQRIQWNHAYRGPPISYMQIFAEWRVGTPNTHVVQGSTVYNVVTRQHLDQEI